MPKSIARPAKISSTEMAIVNITRICPGWQCLRFLEMRLAIFSFFRALEIRDLVKRRWQDKIPHFCQWSDLLKRVIDFGDIDCLARVLAEDVIDNRRNSCLVPHSSTYLTRCRRTGAYSYLSCNRIGVA